MAVNDLITVDASVAFNPPEPLKAGMVVVDVSVPTGFAPVDESLKRLLDAPKMKRYDVAGRKVIFYIEDMAPGESIHSPSRRGPLPGAGQGGGLPGLLLLQPRVARRDAERGAGRAVTIAAQGCLPTRRYVGQDE